MIAPRAVVAVGAEVLEKRLGLWCDHCLLPSRCEVVLAITLNDRAGCLKTFTVCEDCGRQGFVG